MIICEDCSAVTRVLWIFSFFFLSFFCVDSYSKPNLEKYRVNTSNGDRLNLIHAQNKLPDMKKSIDVPFHQKLKIDVSDVSILTG